MRSSLVESDFNNYLESSRVYTKIARRHSTTSMTSNSLRNAALSVFSKLSLAQVSNIALYTLPVSATDLTIITPSDLVNEVPPCSFCAKDIEVHIGPAVVTIRGLQVLQHNVISIRRSAHETYSTLGLLRQAFFADHHYPPAQVLLLAHKELRFAQEVANHMARFLEIFPPSLKRSRDEDLVARHLTLVIHMNSMARILKKSVNSYMGCIKSIALSFKLGPSGRQTSNLRCDTADIVSVLERAR